MKHSNCKLPAYKVELRQSIIHFETVNGVKVHARNFDVFSVKAHVCKLPSNSDRAMPLINYSTMEWSVVG
jgi:hypothetical protein